MKKFPFEAKQTFWRKKDEHYNEEVITCIAKMQSLLSYYFTANDTLARDPSYSLLFGNLIAGIDNSKEWEEFSDLRYGGCPDPSGVGTDSAPDDCIVSETD